MCCLYYWKWKVFMGDQLSDSQRPLLSSECEWGVSPDVDWYGMGSTAPHKSWIRWAFVLRPYPTLTRPEPGSNTLLPSVLQGPQACTQQWHTYLRLTFPWLKMYSLLNSDQYDLVVFLWSPVNSYNVYYQYLFYSKQTTILPLIISPHLYWELFPDRKTTDYTSHN